MIDFLEHQYKCKLQVKVLDGFYENVYISNFGINSLKYVATKVLDFVLYDIKDTHREKALSHKAPALSMNIDIWVVGKPNELFIRGS